MQYAFLTIFALFWSAIVLMFDGLMGHNMFKQFESRHYAVTAGKVIHSEVKTHRGSKGGTSYEAVINYRFELGGQSFFGSRLRYNKGSSSSLTANSIVDVRPVGATVQVFYDPENPHDSLLFPGLDGSDFMMVLFLTPFNAIMLGFWTWIGSWLRRRLFRQVAGGVKIISDTRFTRVQLPQYGAIVWGLATTGALAFVSVFVVGFSTNMQPSFPLSLSTLSVVYLAGVGVYLWQWLKIHSGIDDLVINHSARTLDLPQTYGRKQRMTVNIIDVLSLTVEKLMHYSNKGGTSYTYALTLHLAGPEPGEQKLADWPDKARADDFADWLRKQLGR
jgi:hypothetical protein